MSESEVPLADEIGKATAASRRHQGMPVLWEHLEAAEPVLGDEPIAGLTLTGSVLLSLGIRN